jgi:hypothetical protein
VPEKKAPQEKGAKKVPGLFFFWEKLSGKWVSMKNKPGTFFS